MPRCLIITAFVLLFLALILTALWYVFDWPPPRLILKYGFPPTGGPTGRTMAIEGVEFMELKPGYFRMGSHFLCRTGDLVGRVCALLRLPWGGQQKHARECPVHWVEFPRGFWMAETEVTNEQYERFDPKHERRPYSPGNRTPVIEVSWEDAQRYCDWLTTRGELDVRLPSESEWENACRGGSRNEYCIGDDEAGLEKYARCGYDDRSNIAEGRASEVKTRLPNAWGLYDMHGNVWEWVEDTYHSSYTGEPTDGRAWTADGEEWSPGMLGRVIRGGSWCDPPIDCRSAVRYRYGPIDDMSNLGFRLAASSR